MMHIYAHLFLYFMLGKEGDEHRIPAGPHLPQRAAAKEPRRGADQAEATARGGIEGGRVAGGPTPFHRHQEDDRGRELAQRGHYCDGQGVRHETVQSGLRQAAARRSPREEGHRSREKDRGEASAGPGEGGQVGQRGAGQPVR